MFAKEIINRLKSNIEVRENEIQSLELELERVREEKKAIESEQQKTLTLIATGESAIEQIKKFVNLVNAAETPELFDSFWQEIEAIKNDETRPIAALSAHLSPEEKYLRSLSKNEIKFLGDFYSILSEDTEDIILGLIAKGIELEDLQHYLSRKHLIKASKKETYLRSLSDGELEATRVYYSLIEDTKENTIANLLSLEMSVSDYKYALANSPLVVETTDDYIKLEDGTIVYKSETTEEFEARIKRAKEEHEEYANSLTPEEKQSFEDDIARLGAYKKETDPQTTVFPVANRKRSRKQIIQDVIDLEAEVQAIDPNRKVTAEELMALTLKELKQYVKGQGMIAQRTKDENVELILEGSPTLGDIQEQLRKELYPELIDRVNSINVA